MYPLLLNSCQVFIEKRGDGELLVLLQQAEYFVCVYSRDDQFPQEGVNYGPFLRSFSNSWQAEGKSVAGGRVLGPHSCLNCEFTGLRPT